MRLDTLPAVDPQARLDHLNKLQEQVHFAAMPPDDEPQPSPSERKLLVDWVRSELATAGAPLTGDKLRYPDYGNAVDHDRLFDGAVTDKPITPAR